MKSVFNALILAFCCFPLFLSAQQENQNPATQQMLNKSSHNFFIENKGQWPKEVRFLAKIGGMNAWITNRGVVYDYYQITRNNKPEQTLNLPPNEKEEFERKNTSMKGHVVNMVLEGANTEAKSAPSGMQEGYYNYFIGNDSTKWASFVRLYSEVLMQDIYPGIDIRYYFDNGLIRYDYISKPGADLAQISLKIKGSDGYKINEKGELTLKTSLGKITHGKLFAYQKIGNRKTEIACSFIKNRKGHVGVFAENYDPALALVIDPLVYSTFIGGNKYDKGTSLSIDSSGNVILAGTTNSTNYPTTSGAYDISINGISLDAFVTKLNASGSALVYSSYIGGSDYEEANSIVIDYNGNAFITGNTSSNNYPTKTGSYDISYNGISDAFVTKLNSTGSALIYSTFIGGSDVDQGWSIAIDASGNAFITGQTTSTNFPITSGAYDASYNGGSSDGFVTKLNASGSTVIYSTYIGGNQTEEVNALVIDLNGNSYITGETYSTNYPTTKGAYDTIHAQTFDIFVTKLNSNGSTLVYSTFIGGYCDDFSFSIAIDNNGFAYITGRTSSSDYPTTTGAYDVTYNGLGCDDNDVFITKLDSTGSALAFSTFIGTSNQDFATSIAIDSSGNAIFTGVTYSSNFPITLGAYDKSYNGGSQDAFLTKMNSNGTALIYSTFIGGSNKESPVSLALDGKGNAFIAGNTVSNDYPTTPGSYDRNYDSIDIFVTKILLFNQANNIILSNITSTNTTCKWTRGGGSKRVVFIKQDTTSLVVPAMNTTYTSNSIFGLGSQVGTSGWYCIYNDTGSTVTVTGLSPNKKYKVMVCEYIGSAGKEIYNTDSVINNPIIFKTSNTTTNIQATNITFTNLAPKTFTATCTKGNGSKRAIFIKVASSGSALPVNNTTYTANTAFGSGSQIGTTGWYCVYNDTGRTVIITGLQSNTTYRVMACEYNGTLGSEQYNTNSATNNPNSTNTTVGINEKQLSKINIYPNPTNGQLVIENAKGYRLTIINSLGETIYYNTVTDNSYTADLKNVTDGIYFLKLEKEGRIFSQEIILRR